MAEVVDGLTWTRSKPDLRMYREMFGMSTAEFGRLAAVDGRTVRAWENPREWVPDRTAWMAAESLWRCCCTTWGWSRASCTRRRIRRPCSDRRGFRGAGG